jgi:hypothetical protein
VDRRVTDNEKLEHLLDLKQKQANLWEARSSREGAESTAAQGNVRLNHPQTKSGHLTHIKL